MEKDINTSSQYDQMGLQYLQSQKQFFNNRDDWSRGVILSHLGDVKNKKILDIGCGGGGDVEALEQKGAIVYGIDPSRVMVSSAKENVSHPDRLQIGDYERIPFGDHKFDIVVGSFSLHYLKTFDSAYREIHRVLVQGGLMLQIVSNPSFDLSYLLEEGHQDRKSITVGLFDGSVRITYPPHRIADYFSSMFFELFDLEKVEEYLEEEVVKVLCVPGALLYIANSR